MLPGPPGYQGIHLLFSLLRHDQDQRALGHHQPQPLVSCRNDPGYLFLTDLLGWLSTRHSAPVDSHTACSACGTLCPPHPMPAELDQAEIPARGILLGAGREQVGDEDPRDPSFPVSCGGKYSHSGESQYSLWGSLIHRWLISLCFPDPSPVPSPSGVIRTHVFQ